MRAKKRSKKKGTRGPKKVLMEASIEQQEFGKIKDIPEAQTRYYVFKWSVSIEQQDFGKTKQRTLSKRVNGARPQETADTSCRRDVGDGLTRRRYEKPGTGVNPRCLPAVERRRGKEGGWEGGREGVRGGRDNLDKKKNENKRGREGGG